MKKILSLMIVAVMALSLMSASAFAEEVAETEPVVLTDWAYAGITLNSEDFGVSSVYYAADYFTREGIINPVTVEPYTAEELKAIADGAVEGAEGYVGNIPADAVVGMGVYEADTVYWFDAENAEKILGNADPLVLNAENGAVSTLEGETVATALPALENWAYAGITLNSEDFGVGSVYYTEKYLEQENVINPVTVAPYTAEELDAIKAGAVVSARAYVTDYPADAVIGMNVYDAEQIFWFDAENAGKILVSADPLVLNAENGAVSTLEGEAVAEAIS